jgi:hypothetical protein
MNMAALRRKGGLDIGMAGGGAAAELAMINHSRGG